MTDEELIKRLRSACYLAFDDGTNDYSSAPDAADRIEALVKERDMAAEGWAEATRLIGAARQQYSEEKARAERLEAALLRIADMPDYRLPKPQDIARAIITEGLTQ